MRSFLPDLMCVRLMRGPVILQLVKQPMTSFRFQLNDDLTSSKALQITQNGRERGSRKYRVQVIVQDHPAINFETLVLSTMLERAHDDVATRRRDKDRQPFDCCCSDEMGGVGVMNPVAAAYLEGCGCLQRAY